MTKVTSKRFNYDASKLTDAIRDVKSKKLSIRGASRTYRVPRTTIQDRISGRIAEGPRKMGPNTILNMREEIELVKWMTNLTKCGFPRKPSDLLNTVQNIIREKKRKTPFKHGRPGKTWYKAFMKRHPVLSIREPEGISKGRAIVTEESIRAWFKDLQTFLESENAANVLLDPKRIFNCDETNFSMCPNTGKVITPIGWKNVYAVQPGKEKETVTMLFTFSANGDIVTPMVVYPYVRLPKELINSVPDSWYIGKSETGWMRTETFFEFIANGFNQWLTDNNIQRPVLLFVDGHKSHMSMELSQFCHDNQIILYCLHPNATHIMQPADVSVFKPLKSDFSKTVKEWQNKCDDMNCVLTKVTFAPLVESILKSKNLAESIRNGFRKSGLYPLDPNAVDYTKCVQNKIERLNSESVTVSNCSPTAEDMHTAVNVISSMREKLTDRGINVDELLHVLEQENNDSVIITAPTVANEDGNSTLNQQTSISDGIYTLDEAGGLLPCPDLDRDDCNFYSDDIDFQISLSVEDPDQLGIEFDTDCGHRTEYLCNTGTLSPQPSTSKELASILANQSTHETVVKEGATSVSSSTILLQQTSQSHMINTVSVNNEDHEQLEKQLEADCDMRTEYSCNMGALSLQPSTSKESASMLANQSNHETFVNAATISALPSTTPSQHNSQSPLESYMINSSGLTIVPNCTFISTQHHNPTPSSSMFSLQRHTPSVSEPISKIFKKHLKYPKPINAIRKRKPKIASLNAISAPLWRKIQKDLEDQKLAKAEAIQKRKADRVEIAKNKSMAIEQRKIEKLEKAKNKADEAAKRLEEKLQKVKTKNQQNEQIATDN